MKYIKIFSLMALLMHLSGFAASDNFPNSNVKVVTVCALSGEEFKQVVEGKFPDLAIEFSKDTVLPLNFYLKGDLLTFTGEQSSIGEVKVGQTFYARFEEGNLLLSLDLVDWKPFLEFITGEITVGLSIDDEQQRSVAFGVKAGARQ